MIEVITGFIIFTIGLVIGSFSNVCIYRIPRNESLVWPGSHCPKCSKQIKFYDNIPLISYIILKGKCRNCGEPIPLQYPIVELATGLFYLALYLFYGLQLIALVYMMLCSVLIIISFIDLKVEIIPDTISLPFIVIGFLLSFFLRNINPLDSMLGIITGGGSLLLVAIFGSKLFKKEAMGGGDIKLAAMIGAFFGWKLTLLSLFLSFFLGSIIGIIVLAASKDKSNNIIPFGPFIALGAMISMFWGNAIIHWYLMI
ncbi:MAG: prepilin peptidase [Atribacterota bacterium]|nr:prepilin peptidase [Atribacterota bacterium]